jgi:hypothetical protein
MPAGKKDVVMQAWKEGKLGVPTDELTRQLGSRAVDHQNWMRADMNTYEIEYEEVCFTSPSTLLSWHG